MVACMELLLLQRGREGREGKREGEQEKKELRSDVKEEVHM